MAEETLRKHFSPYTPAKGEEYMSEKQLAHFRAMLESIRREMMEDIDRTVHTMQDEATVFADPNDRASQESDMALELRNRDRERRLIKKINETLARIEAESTAIATVAASRSGSSASRRAPPRTCASTARPSRRSASGKWPSRLRSLAVSRLYDIAHLPSDP
jgi:RNA polymerase-binding protein DksA